MSFFAVTQSALKCCCPAWSYVGIQLNDADIKPPNNPSTPPHSPPCCQPKCHERLVHQNVALHTARNFLSLTSASPVHLIFPTSKTKKHSMSPESGFWFKHKTKLQNRAMRTSTSQHTGDALIKHLWVLIMIWWLTGC